MAKEKEYLRYDLQIWAFSSFLRGSVLTFQFPIFTMFFGWTSGLICPRASVWLSPPCIIELLMVWGVTTTSPRSFEIILLLVSVIMCFFTGVGYQPAAQPPTWRTRGCSSSGLYPSTNPAWLDLPGTKVPAGTALLRGREWSNLPSSRAFQVQLTLWLGGVTNEPTFRHFKATKH